MYSVFYILFLITITFIGFYITICMLWHSCWVGGYSFLNLMIWLVILLTRYPVIRFVLICIYKLYFLAGGLGPVYRWNSVKFLIDFRELGYFRNLMSDRSGWNFCFSNELWYHDALRVLGWVPKKWNPFKDTRWFPRVNFWVRVWQFYWYKSYWFFKPFFHFY